MKLNGRMELRGLSIILVIVFVVIPFSPVTEAATCTVTDVTNAEKSSNVSELTEGSSITYTCDTGYETNDGASALTVTCEANSSLSSALPTCSVKKCSAVGVPHSSKTPDQEEYNYNTKVTYDCLDGYSHTGGNLTRKCQADKTWSGKPPSCSKIQLGKYGCVNSTLVLNSCEDVNALCDEHTKCICKDDYYDDNGDSVELGTCQQKVQLGKFGCSKSTMVSNSCADTNAFCGEQTKCICKDIYYDDNGESSDGGTCQLKVGLGRPCSTAVNNSCNDSNAYCEPSSITCKCLSDYYDNNGDNTADGSCEAKVGIDDICETDISVTDDQCKDQNAKCRTSNGAIRCLCKTGYYADFETGNDKVCVANKPLGGPCTEGSTGQCSDSNGSCLPGGSDYICTCKIGFFDDNGFVSGGHCQSMSKLMVSTITFSNVHTEGFTLSWTAPSDVGIEHVSEYRVSWTPDSGEMTNINTTTTAANIPELTPGNVYTVTITTVNDVTQKSSERTVSMSKTQSTKAGTPGTINSTTSELNATNNIITIKWAASQGQVSKYRVQVFDGTEEKSKTSELSASAVVSFDGMKNGQEYTVNITAESLPFDGDNTVDSDTHSEVIKTVVMPPTAPRELTCHQSSDVYIILVWENPEYPNGDLVQYHIEVYLRSNNTKIKTKQTNTPVREFTVEDLEPGTYYTFHIYTENEKFQSEDFNMTECKTSDRVSQAPADITVFNITNRSLVVSWNSPINSYGEILAYVLQLHDDSNVCVKEVITKCNDCTGKLNFTAVVGDCTDTATTYLSKTNMLEPKKISHMIQSLLPYSNYSITVAAVTEMGKGHPVEELKATLEEAPAKPKHVAAHNITAKSFTVRWSKGAVRPGRTTYIVKVTAAEPAVSQEKAINGYQQESYTVVDLEEYWDYSVIVTAFTSVGQADSDVVKDIKTLPAEPGPVDAFEIVLNYDGSFRLIQIRWKLPVILQRNSEIVSFILTDKTQKTTKVKTFGVDPDPDYVYTEIRTVLPDHLYTYQVCAVNSQNQNGEYTTETIEAPAGRMYFLI